MTTEGNGKTGRRCGNREGRADRIMRQNGRVKDPTLKIEGSGTRQTIAEEHKAAWHHEPL
jgi:hypothetical protein